MSNYRIINAERIPDLALKFGLSKTMPGDYFDYVGKWRVKFNSSGYGMAHRIALKRDVKDKEHGYRYLLVAHFAVPVTRKEIRVPLEEIERMYMDLEDLMEETGIIIAARFGIVYCMLQATPEPMKMDLEEVLSKIEV